MTDEELREQAYQRELEKARSCCDTCEQIVRESRREFERGWDAARATPDPKFTELMADARAMQKALGKIRDYNPEDPKPLAWFADDAYQDFYKKYGAVE